MEGLYCEVCEVDGQRGGEKKPGKGKKKRLRAKLSKRANMDAKGSRDQPPQDKYMHRSDAKRSWAAPRGCAETTEWHAYLSAYHSHNPNSQQLKISRGQDDMELHGTKFHTILLGSSPAYWY